MDNTVISNALATLILQKGSIDKVSDMLGIEKGTLRKFLEGDVEIRKNSGLLPVLEDMLTLHKGMIELLSNKENQIADLTEVIINSNL